MWQCCMSGIDSIINQIQLLKMIWLEIVDFLLKCGNVGCLNWKRKLDHFRVELLNYEVIKWMRRCQRTIFRKFEATGFSLSAPDVAHLLAVSGCQLSAIFFLLFFLFFLSFSLQQHCHQLFPIRQPKLNLFHWIMHLILFQFNLV